MNWRKGCIIIASHCRLGGSYYISSQSDSPLGPFTIVNENIPMGHSGGHGDFYGFQDPDTNKAYIVYNTGIYISYMYINDKYEPKTLTVWNDATKKNLEFLSQCLSMLHLNSFA